MYYHWYQNLLKRFVLKLIRFYQKVFSLDQGFMRHLIPNQGHCKFYPRCSDYAYQAIERFGLMRGGWMGMRRLMRCHPLSNGGVDEVPKE